MTKTKKVRIVNCTLFAIRALKVACIVIPFVVAGVTAYKYPGNNPICT